MISGISTNQAEDMNNLYKSILKRKTRPLDFLALILLKTSQYYLNEVKLGYGNRGNYKLMVQHQGKYIDTRHMSLIEFTDPSKIIEEMLQIPDKIQSILVEQYRVNDEFEKVLTTVCENEVNTQAIYTNDNDIPKSDEQPPLTKASNEIYSESL
jgi:hypothetical protein